MRYIICYDIDNDKLRNKVSDILEAVGIRVQESVFECKISQNNVNILAEKLAELITTDDSIIIYPVCKECFKKTLIVGEKKQYHGAKGYLII